jgi:hypothetical protein
MWPESRICIALFPKRKRAPGRSQRSGVQVILKKNRCVVGRPGLRRSRQRAVSGAIENALTLHGPSFPTVRV